ncbi:MAG: hypothetical protein ABSE89_12645 [Sedimentisphaerales bacterium]
MSPLSEIDVMKAVEKAFKKINDEAARNRILKWAWDKFSSKEQYPDYRGSGHPARERNKKSNKKGQKEIEPLNDSLFDIAKFVGQIKDSKIYEQVEKNIIDKRNQLAKILMCLYFAREFLETPYLTTGQIEAITNELNIKVEIANASNVIKKNQKYFTGKTVRKRGLPVPYKLNRLGEKAFEKMLNGEKLK